MDEAINQHILYLELIQGSDPNYPDMATDFKIFTYPNFKLLETLDEIYVMESINDKMKASFLLNQWFRKNNL